MNILMPDGKLSVRRTVSFSGVSVHNNFVDLISYNGVIATCNRKLKFALITGHNITAIQNAPDTVHI